METTPETSVIEWDGVKSKYEKYSDSLTVMNGSVYRRRSSKGDHSETPDGERVLQWIPPISLRWGILKSTHRSPDAGHPGFKVMLQRIQDVMW
jgi:hypothetical protein